MAKVNFRSNRLRRHRRVRAKIIGTAARPRLSVSRSSKHILVQLVDDVAGRTLFSMSDVKLPAAGKTKETRTKSASSFLVGEELAKKALAQKINQAVFDRGGFSYTGRIKALADGARRGGLKF